MNWTTTYYPAVVWYELRVNDSLEYQVAQTFPGTNKPWHAQRVIALPGEVVHENVGFYATLDEAKLAIQSELPT